MTREERDAANQAAVERLKPTIDSDYPHGQFVAVHDGRIVADDADFDALTAKLDDLGIDLWESVIDRSGEDTVGEVIIL